MLPIPKMVDMGISHYLLVLKLQQPWADIHCSLMDLGTPTQTKTAGLLQAFPSGKKTISFSVRCLGIRFQLTMCEKHPGITWHMFQDKINLGSTPSLWMGHVLVLCSRSTRVIMHSLCCSGCGIKRDCVEKNHPFLAFPPKLENVLEDILNKVGSQQHLDQFKAT